MQKLFGFQSASPSPSSHSAPFRELPKHGLTPTSVSAVADPSEAKVGLHLASRLFAQLCSGGQEEFKNLLVSPLSVGVAMSLTMLGARGQTAAQLRALLTAAPGSASSADEEAQLVQSLAEEWSRLSHIEKRNGVEWASTNGLWLSKDCPVSPDLAALSGRLHGATITDDVPFPTDPEGSRNTINNAITKQTQGLITDLLSPSSISTDTRLVITNAVYFKATWLSPFKATNTVRAHFNLLDEAGQVEVDMMHNGSISARHGSFETHSMVALPYKDQAIAMLILVPHDNTTAALQKVWSAETMVGISKAYEGLSSGDVDLWMPKFKLEYQQELTEPIRQLGATLPFSDSAEFEGLTKNGEPLKIGAIFHKTFMNVDEEGTEAAAATVVVASRSRRPPDAPTAFVVDKPFVCVLYHVQLESVLFVGRVCNPKP